MGCWHHIEEVGEEEDDSSQVESGECGVEFSQGYLIGREAGDGREKTFGGVRTMIFQDELYLMQKAADEIERDIRAVGKERRGAVKEDLKRLQILDGQHARLSAVMDLSQRTMRNMLVHEVIPLVKTLYITSRGVKGLERGCETLRSLADRWKERSNALDAEARVVENELRVCAKERERLEQRVVESRQASEEKRLDVDQMSQALREEVQAIMIGVKELEALSCQIEKQSAQKSTLVTVSKILDDMTIDWLDQVESLERDHRIPLERECDEISRECNEIGCILQEISKADTPVMKERASKAITLPYDDFSRIKSLARDEITKLEKDIVRMQSQMILTRREMKDLCSQHAKVINRTEETRKRRMCMTRKLDVLKKDVCFLQTRLSQQLQRTSQSPPEQALKPKDGINIGIKSKHQEEINNNIKFKPSSVMTQAQEDAHVRQYKSNLLQMIQSYS